jgi:hypothetical protein
MIERRVALVAIGLVMVLVNLQLPDVGASDRANHLPDELPLVREIEAAEVSGALSGAEIASLRSGSGDVADPRSGATLRVDNTGLVTSTMSSRTLDAGRLEQQVAEASGAVVALSSDSTDPADELSLFVAEGNVETVYEFGL